MDKISNFQKNNLLGVVCGAKIFSKFDTISTLWKFQITEKDRYKTAFIVPFGHHKWNVMPCGLRNAPTKFQHIKNYILNDYSKFSTV